MKPQWYCDAMPLVVGGDTGAGGPVLRGRMLGLFHGLFVQKTRCFALAFPRENKIRFQQNSPLSGALRVFASSREDLDWLAEKVSVLPWFRDYARLFYPRQVPADFTGEWIRYIRYRVPSLSSDRHTGDEHGKLWQRRMTEAQKASLTYFILQSKTTGQRFSLLVRCETGQPQEEECLPNGYGFSVASRPFSLPELPWE